MAFILALFSRIAATIKAPMAITTMIGRTSTSDAVEAATRLHNWLFAGYMVLIGLAALFTYLVWRSGNRVQDAIQAEARARIEEAKRGASDADERSKKLEADNLILRGQVVTLEGAVVDAKKGLAGLQKAADDAKTAQQRVEIELAKQQERAAKAERSLLEVQERVKLRHLSADQRKKLIDFLKAVDAAKGPKGSIRVNRLMLDETAQPFATEIKEALDAAGWSSGEVGKEVVPSGPVPIGLVVIFHSSKAIPAHAGVIQQALFAAGLEPTLGENANVPEGIVEILVGVKP